MRHGSEIAWQVQGQTVETNESEAMKLFFISDFSAFIYPNMTHIIFIKSLHKITRHAVYSRTSGNIQVAAVDLATSLVQVVLAVG
jgi:hypothetical protein